jgi:hypothetical protein
MRNVLSLLTGAPNRIFLTRGGSNVDAYSANGVRPFMVLDFSRSFYWAGGSDITFGDALSFGRASDATMFNAAGQLVTVAQDTPRENSYLYDADTDTWVNNGLFLEAEARTQLLHTTNALVTQSHTVTAVPHTLHFTGTGTVTLSGASTAGPLVGTGTGNQNRVSLTFTPTAASLTLTVTGTVSDAQLEVGSTPSSYIPNPAASGTVTRAAETAVIERENNPLLEVGPELVTNGTFDTDVDGWTSARENSVLSFSAGAIRATSDAAGAYGPVQELPATVVGQVYQYSVNVVNQTNKGTSAFFRVSGSSDLSDTNPLNVGITTEGVLTGTFVATNTALSVGVIGVAASGGDFVEIDNISIKSLSMPTALSIGLKGKVTGASSTFFNWTADADNGLLVQSSASDFTFTQEAATVVDTVTGGSYTSGINQPFNLASRHGNTFINGAVDGIALTANLTPTALPNLVTADFQIGPDFMGHIQELPLYAADVADTGLEEITG